MKFLTSLLGSLYWFLTLFALEAETGILYNRESVFLMLLHSQKPVLKGWEVDDTLARTRSQAPSAQQGGDVFSRGAPRPRTQPLSDTLAGKYLCVVDQLVQEKEHAGARKAMEGMLALQQEDGLQPSPEDHFRYARIWSDAGESAPSGTSGIRAGETVVFDGMEFVWIPPGEFAMGSTSPHAFPHEQPVTQVRISRGFYLGKYEVTQDHWQSVTGNNPSEFSGCGRCPVERVTWNDAQEFIARLNARPGGGKYRLPTEAEWEYAARAGTDTDTYAGDITNPIGNDPVLNVIAWYRKNSGRRTQPVGQKEPNGFGLYDMLGNVCEWVGDWDGDYPGGAVTDPTGPAWGSGRVTRGGCWKYIARQARSADRGGVSPGDTDICLGFRLLRTE